MIAYLSKPSNRVFKTLDEADQDACEVLSLKVNTDDYNKAKKIANLKLKRNYKKYINMVFLYI